MRGLTLKIEAGSSVGRGRRRRQVDLGTNDLRLYPVQSGSVLVDGVDVASVGLGALRGRVAIVPQAPTLFAGTIRFNLDMFGEGRTRSSRRRWSYARGRPRGLGLARLLTSLFIDGATEVAATCRQTESRR